MPNTSAFAGYTNIGNRRVRKDDIANPTVETSAIIVEQPSGYVFDETDHTNNKLKHAVTGVELSTAASFAVFAGDTGYAGWIGFHDSLTGDADDPEVAIDAELP